RRHTRLVSDWSSDVCSSDLGVRARRDELLVGLEELRHERGDGGVTLVARPTHGEIVLAGVAAVAVERLALRAPRGVVEDVPVQRSEERRVGKESGTRRWSDV